MVNEKISQLTAGAPALATDLIPIARSGANYSLEISDVQVSSASPITTFPAAVTSLTAFGDSITLGSHLPLVTQNWAALFAASLGIASFTDAAVSGARMNQAGFITSAYAVAPSAAVGSIGLYGTNEMVDATTSANRSTIGNAFQAMGVWLSLPSSLIVLAGALTAVGSWSTTSAFGLNAMYSTTPGDTLTGAVSGTTIYVAGFVDGSFTVEFDVLVDGTSTSGNVGYTLTDGLTAAGHYPFCLRFSGFSAGTHTVEIKAMGSGAQYTVIQWIGGNGTSAQVPFCAMGGAMQQEGVLNSTVIALNSVLSGVVANLKTDNLNVAYVDDYSAVTITASPAEFYYDDLHPNIFGNTLLCAKWLETFYAALSYPATAGVNADFFVQIAAKAGLIPEMLVSMYESYISSSTPPQNAGGPGLVLAQFIAATGTFTAVPGTGVQYAVASLPVSPSEGMTAYATNGRKVGESGGAGTGVPVYFSNSQWRVYSTDAQVQA